MRPELTERKERILQAIVDEYVETGEPVGSQWLATRYDFGCRSATLRNAMSELSEAGLLKQPHTSAGRIPTAYGYRYYVDRLMAPVALRARPDFVEEVTQADIRDDINELVRAACRFLVELTEYPSVASTPTRGDVRLHRLFLAYVDSMHLMLVVLLSTGHTESRIVELDCRIEAAAVHRLSERLNALLARRPVREIIARGVPPGPEGAPYETPETLVQRAVYQVAKELRDDELMVEGTNVMLRHREFRDVLRMETVLSALLEGNALVNVLRHIGDAEGVTVIIGPEMRSALLDECSVVTRRYEAGSQGWGYIGVLGPTRMRYARAVAAVELTARALSTVLCRTSFA